MKLSWQNRIALLALALCNIHCSASTTNTPDGDRSAGVDYNANKAEALKMLKVKQEGTFEGCGRIYSAKCLMSRGEGVGALLAGQQARQQLEYLCPKHQASLRDPQIFTSSVGNSTCALVAVARWGLKCH